MARKIKLPLDMGNDIKVRDIEELKANYNSEKVVESFLNGELLPWLRDRFYEEEAERVEALSADKDSGNIAGRLAEIFGVHIESEVDVEEIAERNERLAKLRSITSDDEMLKNVDLVAFSQEDMDIVHESDVIYLCGDKFRIPYNVKNKRYIGVNEPLVEIRTEGAIDLESRGIVIEKCRFTEEMLSRLPKKVESKVNAEVGVELNVEVNDIPEADDIFGEISRYYSPKGAKGDLSSFERVEFNETYIKKNGFGDLSSEKGEICEILYENVYIYISGKESLWLRRQVSMKLKNCVIHIGVSEAAGESVFIIHGLFNAVFSHCTFIFDEYGADKTSELHSSMSCYDNDIGYLFDCFSSYRQNICFDECLFIHSNYLVKTSYDKCSFTISFDKCHFINCYANICRYQGIYEDRNSKVYVNDCAIYQDGRDMSFYSDNFSVNGLIMFLLYAEMHSSKNIFDMSKVYLLSASGNLIMQSNSFNGGDEDDKPIIFETPSGNPIRNSLHADPSDRVALDRFFE